MEAQQAINTLLDTELKGRLIFVREDREAAGKGKYRRRCTLNAIRDTASVAIEGAES